MNPFEAIRGDQEAHLRSALDGECLDTTNEFGQSLLHEAIAYRRPRLARLLVERGIDVNHQDHNGQTPLHFLASHPDLDLASRVLAAGGDPNRLDRHGNGALWAAVFSARGEYGFVELLLRHGADPRLRNRAGRSPLDFATQIGDKALVNLLARGATRSRSGNPDDCC